MTTPEPQVKRGQVFPTTKALIEHAQEKQAALMPRCADCGYRAYFIDGCPICRRITEIVHVST